MKPPLFHYHDPVTVSETLDLLAEYGDEAKVLAGGQSLMPLLNLRLSRPDQLVDINRLTELRGIEVGAEVVTIRTLTRHVDVEQSPELAAASPLLADAVSFIGHRVIRNRGTIGGSLAHADPSAELPAVMTALGATVTLTSHGGVRRVPASDFFVMPLTTVMEAEELLTQVEFPRQSPTSGSAVEELARRSGDFALVGVVATVDLDPSGRVGRSRLVSFATGPRPIRLVAAEEALQGRPLDEGVLEEASLAAAAEISPTGDRQGSAEFRRSVTGVLVTRAVRRAGQRALQAQRRHGDGG
jgi:carbon-monoxide dehydrogenase medium subunit